MVFLHLFFFFAKVSPVERFLEKSHTSRSRSSSRGSSPGRSPVHHHHDHGSRTSLIDEHVHGFKVNIKPERKSKFSSIVLKLRGIEEVKFLLLEGLPNDYNVSNQTTIYSSDSASSTFSHSYSFLNQYYKVSFKFWASLVNLSYGAIGTPCFIAGVITSF